MFNLFALKCCIHSSPSSEEAGKNCNPPTKKKTNKSRRKNGGDIREMKGQKEKMVETHSISGKRRDLKKAKRVRTKTAKCLKLTTLVVFVFFL